MIPPPDVGGEGEEAERGEMVGEARPPLPEGCPTPTPDEPPPLASCSRKLGARARPGLIEPRLAAREVVPGEREPEVLNGGWSDDDCDSCED